MKFSRVEAEAKAASKRLWKDYVETKEVKEEPSEQTDSNLKEIVPALTVREHFSNIMIHDVCYTQKCSSL